MAGENNGNCPVDENEEMAVYKKDALAVVSFKIVLSKKDWQLQKFYQFKPEMAHQVFGENEKIFGYRSLSINLCYLHNSSKTFLHVRSSGQIQNANMPPDNIIESLNPWLPENFTTEEKTFEEMLEDEKHDMMFGTVLDEFKGQDNGLFPDQKVEVKYKVTLCDTSDEMFKDFHRRFETFIVWFIDGANFIDLDDERWLIFYIYEEFIHPEYEKPFVTPVGFCSVYKFFAYPDKIRARISQCFVLPSHQRKGIGRKLYHNVVKHLRSISDILDITVEEPTSAFQKIRDFDDSILVLESFKNAKLNVVTSPQKNIANHMKSQFKLCKRQCQRILDILRTLQASKSKWEYEKCLSRIKSRIRAEVERDIRSKKIHLTSEEMAFVEPTDKLGLIEIEVKKYIGDIEPSIKSLVKHLNSSE